MNDKFTSDDILVALCQKFGNSTEIIDDVIDKNIFMTDKEKEYYLNKVHENYISFLSDDYPVILGGLMIHQCVCFTMVILMYFKKIYMFMKVLLIKQTRFLLE